MMRKRADPAPNRMRSGRWWLATFAGALGVALAIGLGCWQLERASQKQALLADITRQTARAPLDASEMHSRLSSPADQWRHRRAQLRGRWLLEHSIYLDNRQMQGRPGFFVLTPMELEQGGVVLVQRGWLPRNFQDRQALLPFETSEGRVTVQGRLADRPGRIYALEEGDSPDPDQPAIRQNLDLSGFARDTGLPLWPVLLVQTDPSGEGLLRDWPLPDQGLAKHHGYAFQWFAIGGVLALLVLWFQFLRPARANHSVHEFKQD